jgi:hypothetical protein
VLSTQKLAVTVIENQTLEIDGEQKRSKEGVKESA